MHSIDTSVWKVSEMAFPSGLLVWMLSSGAMAYVYYGVLRLPRGFIRLTASLPLIAFYVYMAPTFETIFERGNYSFFFIWLTSFKIVLLCWDDGPAADPWAVASFPRFLAVMTLSLQIKRESFGKRFQRQVAYTKLKHKLRRDSTVGTDVVAKAQDRKAIAGATKLTNLDLHSDIVTSKFPDQLAALTDARNTAPTDWKVWVNWVDSSEEWHMVVLRLLFKLVILMVLTSSYKYRSSIPPVVLYIVYSLHMYICCSMVFEFIAVVVSPMLGIQIEAAYNKPFLAHSLGDFWSRRWNLLVSNLLRVSIYDPILLLLLRNHKPGLTSTVRQPREALPNGQSSNEQQQFKGNKKTSAAAYAVDPPLWPRCIAMFSCFLVSGLMHELIFYNMSRSNPTWVATIFFTVNGAATILEVAVRRMTRLRFPAFISTPLTLAFVLVTAIWFFYPAIVDEAGTDDKIIAEFQFFFHRLRQVVEVSLVSNN